MWFECEQPFLSGERCVTSRKTAAKETIYSTEEFALLRVIAAILFRKISAVLGRLKCPEFLAMNKNAKVYV